MDYEAVIEGNKNVHSIEAIFYDTIHQEIWNKKEQARLVESLKSSIELIRDNNWRALDYGAGTGNLTEKLLDLGFSVTAIDITPAMCEILKNKFSQAIKRKKLTVLCANIDNIQLPGNYDFAGCYSVLHHMPNVNQTLERLSSLVKCGGVLYCDHEKSEKLMLQGKLAHAVFSSYWFINNLLYKLWLKRQNIRIPKIDYRQADVNCDLDWLEILRLLRNKGFEVIKNDYFEHSTKYNLFIDFFYERIVGRNASCIIGIKSDEASIESL